MKKIILFLNIALFGLCYPCYAQFYDNDDEVLFYYRFFQNGRNNPEKFLQVYAFNFAGNQAAVLSRNGYPSSHSLFNLNNTLIKDNLYFEKIIFDIDNDCIIKYKYNEPNVRYAGSWLAQFSGNRYYKYFDFTPDREHLVVITEVFPSDYIDRTPEKFKRIEKDELLKLIYELNGAKSQSWRERTSDNSTLYE